MKNEENDTFFDDLAALNDKEPERRKKIDDKREQQIRAMFAPVPKIDCKDVEWQIEGILPKGIIGVVTGEQETGKSTILSQTAVAAATGTATPFDDPDTFKGRKPAKVIYIDLEEDVQRVTAPRIKALGGNDNLVMLNEGNDESSSLLAELKTDSELMKQVFEIYRPDLFILAPLSNFLPDKCNPSKKKDIASALSPLNMLAKKYNTAVLILQHMNKTTTTSYRKAISDSSYISEIARVVLMMNKVPGEENKVYCSLEKSSYINVFDRPKTRIFEFDRKSQRLMFAGTTDKKFRDFQLMAQGRDVAETNKAATDAAKTTKLGETKRIILETLREFGQMERDWCIRATQEAGASAGSWEKAIRQLKDEGAIDVDVVWNGHVKTATYKIAGSQDDTPCTAKTEEADDDDVIAIF